MKAASGNAWLPFQGYPPAFQSVLKKKYILEVGSRTGRSGFSTKEPGHSQVYPQVSTAYSSSLVWQTVDDKKPYSQQHRKAHEVLTGCLPLLSERLLSERKTEPEEEVMVAEEIKQLQNGCCLAMVRKLTLNQRIAFSLVDMFGLRIEEADWKAFETD